MNSQPCFYRLELMMGIAQVQGRDGHPMLYSDSWDACKRIYAAEGRLLGLGAILSSCPLHGPGLELEQSGWTLQAAALGKVCVSC